jgi:hypothetical protein
MVINFVNREVHNIVLTKALQYIVVQGFTGCWSVQYHKLGNGS